MGKILALDIETTNLKADFGFVLAFGYQWLANGGEPRILKLTDYNGSFHRDPTNDSRLVRDIHAILTEADMWVSHYGKMFDLPFLRTRMLAASTRLYLPPTPHVDLYFTSRANLALHSNRLGVLQEALGIENRKTRLATRAWIRAAAGHVPSLREVAKHCYHDIEGLVEEYEILRPYVRLHPNVTGYVVNNYCRFCGVGHLQRRGYQVTRTARKIRVQCQNCAAWDTRNVPKTEGE